MKFYVQKDEGNMVRYALKDASTTLIEPIIEQLNKNADVKYARYVVDHPDLTDPVLEIMVNAGTPKDALLKAAQEVEQIFAQIGVQ